MRSPGDPPSRLPLTIFRLFLGILESELFTVAAGAVESAFLTLLFTQMPLLSCPKSWFRTDFFPCNHLCCNAQRLSAEPFHASGDTCVCPSVCLSIRFSVCPSVCACESWFHDICWTRYLAGLRCTSPLLSLGHLGYISCRGLGWNCLRCVCMCVCLFVSCLPEGLRVPSQW